jgi:hypothetical protein
MAASHASGWRVSELELRGGKQGLTVALQGCRLVRGSWAPCWPAQAQASENGDALG